VSEGVTPSDREHATDESPPKQAAALVRHEDELAVDVQTRQHGSVSVDKRVEHEHVREVVPRTVEEFDGVERAAAREADSGEIEFLPDGSVSIPIIEEELVIEKRAIVRERIIVRKRIETRHEQVDATLRKERVDADLERET
jgi:uncharacterized protein (TIGR02271 family)